MSIDIQTALLEIGVIVPSVVLHEVSHGYVAYKCGDDTAKRAGRLTLNPIPHIDPVGSILLPALMIFSGLPPIGYARPVPVSINRLRKPRNQSVYVALAGPIVNLLLVVLAWGVCSILIQYNYGLDSDLFVYFILLGIINLFLAVFNLIPIPPLDGSAVVERLVPRKHLGTYFELRRRMLPVVLILALMTYYFHWADRAIAWLESQFFNLLPH